MSQPSDSETTSAVETEASEQAANPEPSNLTTQVADEKAKSNNDAEISKAQFDQNEPTVEETVRELVFNKLGQEETVHKVTLDAGTSKEVKFDRKKPTVEEAAICELPIEPLLSKQTASVADEALPFGRIVSGGVLFDKSPTGPPPSFPPIEATLPGSTKVSAETPCHSSTPRPLLGSLVYVQINARSSVKGYVKASKLTDRRYVCFTDIPYAKPPVGRLRFEPPEPFEEWRTVINLAIDRKLCMQIESPKSNVVIGSEDCLYLSIYTPEPESTFKNKGLLPVMVFIHGGGFHRGSGSSSAYVPDSFVEHNVIFVTLNYRLHIFGFLNLDIPECTGNFGMKDQVMALRWIQRYISKFGGNPENVTIFGSSAGGSAVNFHMISPMSEGLFHKAIAQSGTVDCPWGLSQNSKLQAYAIARKLGCSSTKEKEMLKFFKQQSAECLTRMTAEVAAKQKREHPCSVYEDSLGPSVECVVAGAFLPEYPHNLTVLARKVPTIAGITQHEGLMMLRSSKPGLTNELKKDLSPILTDNFKCKKSKKELHERLRVYYMSDTKFSGQETTERLSNIFTDLAFSRIHESFRFVTKSYQPIYFYEFRYAGKLNFFKLSENDQDRRAVQGASHSDELAYLFYPQKRMLETPNERDQRMVNIMSSMWTTFAKCGNPTADLEPEIVWEPSTTKNPCYLRIDEEPTMVNEKLNSERFEYMTRTLIETTRVYFRQHELDDLLLL